MMLVILNMVNEYEQWDKIELMIKLKIHWLSLFFFVLLLVRNDLASSHLSWLAFLTKYLFIWGIFHLGEKSESSR